jgi:serine/threonine protein kinase
MGDLVGARLGDFEISRELGRGGMGIVYEARQISLNRRVAIGRPAASGLPGPFLRQKGTEVRDATKTVTWEYVRTRATKVPVYQLYSFLYEPTGSSRKSTSRSPGPAVCRKKLTRVL